MLSIGKEFANEMIAHSQEDDPNECCGILSGDDETIKKLYRITNSTPSPFRYQMDPQDFLNAMQDGDNNGWDMLAFYHSHTHSPAYPSKTDVRMALESWMLDVYYVLVSLENKDEPQIRAFHIGEEGEITEEEYQVV